MIEAEAMTHAERLLWLAEQEVECPHIRAVPGSPWYGEWVAPTGCKFCGGSGKVLRFPTLRQKCPNPWYQHDNCEDCQGQGWVLVNSLEVTLSAIDHSGFLVSVSNTPSMTMARWSAEIDNKVEYSDNPNEAAILALYQAAKETP